MIKQFLYSILFLIVSQHFYAQQTKVYGKITDALTGEFIPYAKIVFQDTKIGILSDSLGFYTLESYYGTDSIVVSSFGFRTQTIAVKKDFAQEINVKLNYPTTNFSEITIRPPDEDPAITLHKRVIKNKNINNKEKLDAYEYELYNKIQFDVNNIGERFGNNPIVKRLDLVMKYLDSTDKGKNYLPFLLSESISNFYFKNKPKKRREVISASQITGIDNFQINQILGDMYLDMNVYDNNLVLFDRSFVSPVSNFARNFYKFYLEDSTFIGSQWCYKLRFRPKRDGDLTLEGEMWIHDTTYAVKRISAKISPGANINYVQDLYFEQEFNLVAKEVWMMTNEKLIIDLKITKKSQIYGFFARKNSSRKYFAVNQKRDDEFYKSNTTVEYLDSAQIRSEAYWKAHRHSPLSEQEVGIENMIDSLENTKMFRSLKSLTYLSSTGYVPIGKFEIGNAFTAIGFNQIETFRTGLALRTSNKFSRRIELGVKAFYGFNDQEFKYGAKLRWNVTQKKRGLLTAYYNYDFEQIGLSPTASATGSTFNSFLANGPLDKLTFVEKVGVNFEKDVKKDLILFAGFDWKEYTPAGIAVFERYNSDSNLININRIQTAEITARIRWTKDEEFLSGAFDRTPLRSKYPVFSVQGIFGVKGVFGSDYNYQKLEFVMTHNRNVGVWGYLKYGVNAGYVFGTVAYPFLKVHEGNQSYWLLTSAFNKLNYFEFISDKYVGGFVEHHWEGLFFDRLPLIKKLKWRLVTSGRMTYGHLSEKHSQEMLIPEFTRRFGYVPYLETSVGIENIFKVFRVDLVWRMTHLEQIANEEKIYPLGVRARWNFSF
ncbi:MAG: DUF5686 family protein [Flavobacteriia bacterium]